MKKNINEFKVFAIKGKLSEMAMGIVIGATFGKIVSSLVNDIIMPPLGLLVSDDHFGKIKINLKPPMLDASGKILSEAVSINIGIFLQNVFDLLFIKHRKVLEISFPSLR